MFIQFADLHCDFQPWRRADGRVFAKPFAFDVETPEIIAHEVPEYILGAASDGERGYFIPPTLLFDFLQTHWGQEMIFHRCVFDLAVINATLKAQGKPMDIYKLVDGQEIWDTLIMHRLYSLGTDGHTCQGKGQSTLDACSQRYLNVVLPKEVSDADGADVRLSWGKWSGRPLKDIPSVYLDYLGKDVLCTYACWRHLLPATNAMFDLAYEIWGYVDDNWLDHVMKRYGPQTHDLQVMAAVALEEIERAGFGLDLPNRNEIVAQLQQRHDDLREELRRHGYLEGESGCQKALQALIRQAMQQCPGVEIPKTAKTDRFSTKEEDLAPLASTSEFIASYIEFTQVRALLNTFLAKMDAPRIHPRYDLLKNTGRTSSRDPNIQGFPRKKKKKGKIGFDIRRCFVPADGKIFYIADYASIELRTLSQSLLTQFKLDSQMAQAINAGSDVHRLVAARMKATGLPDASEILADPEKFAKLAASVTSEERNAAKPANFGLPAGMGVPRLKNYAQVQYDQPYTDEDAQGWKDAWLASFPEMNEFRKDNSDSGLALAKELGLTLGDYHTAIGRRCVGSVGETNPIGWLGGMALKVLKEGSPMTKQGKPYSLADIEYFWDRLKKLEPSLKPKMAEAIRKREPSEELQFTVKKYLDRAGVFTLTGRLRAKASYSARRNTVFQGAAADGVKFALYRLWRAGFQVVAFIHDEVVVEVPDGGDLAAGKQQIDGILISSMREICPDICIEVEGAFHRHWSKDKADEVPVNVGHPEADTPEIVVIPS